MSCELVERDLDAYLDRELDSEASAALRDHVRTCAACRRQLAKRETLARLVRGAPYYSAPDRLRHECWHNPLDPSRSVASSHGRQRRCSSFQSVQG